MNMEKIGNGSVISLAHIYDYRLPIWPVGRVKCPLIIESSWGAVRFDHGTPNGRHQDIIEAIAVCALSTKFDEDHRLNVLFDAVEVKQLLLSDDWHWIKSKLTELKEVAVTIKPSGEDWGQTWRVLDDVGDSKADAPRTGNKFKAKLKKITFSKHWTSILETSLIVKAKPEIIKSVLGLKNQVSRNLARWCLSHATNQHHQLCKAMDAIGCGGGARMARKYALQLTMDDYGLRDLGIKIADNTVHYERTKGIWFQRRTKTTEPISAGDIDNRNQYRLEPEPLSAVKEGVRNHIRLDSKVP